MVQHRQIFLTTAWFSLSIIPFPRFEAAYALWPTILYIEIFLISCTLLIKAGTNQSKQLTINRFYPSVSCDLAFMLDASSSIQGEADFKLCIEFIKVVFHAFGMGGGIRFALVIFGSSAQVVFDFSKYSSISDVDSALSQVGIDS